MTVLLVDAANTVGARPDGWWRDRAGATERLLVRLARLPGAALPGRDGAPLHYTGVLAVVEGRARGAPEPSGVRLVRAPRSGDDALAEEAAALVAAEVQLLVVTADRGLRGRLPPGTPVTGPGWLLAAVEHVRGEAE